MVGMANFKIFFKVTGFKYTFWFSIIFFLLDFCFDPACISCIKHHKPYSNSAVNNKQQFRRKNFSYILFIHFPLVKSGTAAGWPPIAIDCSASTEIHIQLAAS